MPESRERDERQATGGHPALSRLLRKSNAPGKDHHPSLNIVVQLFLWPLLHVSRLISKKLVSICQRYCRDVYTMRCEVSCLNNRIIPFVDGNEGKECEY